MQDSCRCFHCVCSKHKAEFWRHAKVNHVLDGHCKYAFMYHTGSFFNVYCPYYKWTGYFIKVISRLNYAHSSL